MRWIYLIAIVPTLTEWLESGAFPKAPREAITDLMLTLLLLAVSWLVCRQHDRILEMAQTDGLTGLLNNRCFHGDLQQEIQRARRQNTPLSLAVLDLDGFKGVNDRHGHAEGDEVLCRVARLISDSVRRHVDRCYRVGGDEFAFLLPGSKASDALKVFDRIRLQAQEEPTALCRYGAGLSGGVVELQAAEQPAEFVRRADELLYTAKSAGKNRILTGG